MKTSTIKSKFELYFVIFILAPISMQADSYEKLVDVRDVLNNADAVLFENGVTKVVSTRPEAAVSGHWIITTYYYKNKNHGNFTYRETVLVANRKKYTTINILRPDGNWSLCSGNAIREPSDMSQTNAIIYHDSKPVMGTVEDVIEDGVQCYRIIIIASTDDKQATLHNYREQMVHRYEFLISKVSGVIIASRYYTKKGKMIYEDRITTLDQNSDFPISNFEISKNYRMLFPDNKSEYEALKRRLRSFITITTSQQKPDK